MWRTLMRNGLVIYLHYISGSPACEDRPKNIKKGDTCRLRKENREFTAPLGESENPVAPFHISSTHITGTYPLTPRRNKYLLTFIHHFKNYVEAFPIPNQTVENCTRVYASQIVTTHGTGSKFTRIRAQVSCPHSLTGHTMR